MRNHQKSSQTPRVSCRNCDEYCSRCRRAPSIHKLQSNLPLCPHKATYLEFGRKTKKIKSLWKTIKSKQTPQIQIDLVHFAIKYVKVHQSSLAHVCWKLTSKTIKSNPSESKSTKKKKTNLSNYIHPLKQKNSPHPQLFAKGALSRIHYGP